MALLRKLEIFFSSSIVWILLSSIIFTNKCENWEKFVKMDLGNPVIHDYAPCTIRVLPSIRWINLWFLRYFFTSIVNSKKHIKKRMLFNFCLHTYFPKRMCLSTEPQIVSSSKTRLKSCLINNITSHGNLFLFAVQMPGDNESKLDFWSIRLSNRALSKMIDFLMFLILYF